MEQEEYRLPPRVLLGSLTLIVGVYLGVLLSQILWTALAAWLLFPETTKAWTERKLTPEEFAAKLELLMPPTLFWIASALTCLTCFLFGCLLVRAARFAPFGHTAFAAVLVGVSYLQFTFDKPTELKWMALVAMLAFPLAILAGSQWMLSRIPVEPLFSDDSSENVD
jgi:hypothetical protein